MNGYRPGRFASLHEAFPQLWALLNDYERIGRMKLLSRMNVPAVVDLDTDAEDVWSVLDASRGLGLLDQVKQMIGHQIRQIMESNGYEHVRNKPLRTSWIFSSGALYQHPDWILFYVHRNRDVFNTKRFCVALTRKLVDLSRSRSSPLDPSDWVCHRKVALPHELDFVLGAPLAEFGWNWRELCQVLQMDSYVILDD